MLTRRRPSRAVAVHGQSWDDLHPGPGTPRMFELFEPFGDVETLSY